MPDKATLTNIVLFITIILTILAKYMTVNKVWVRKHDGEVADSVSVSALLRSALIQREGYFQQTAAPAPSSDLLATGELFGS